MNALDYLWGLGLLVTLPIALAVWVLWFSIRSMKPTVSHAIGLGFLALALLAALAVFAVEYGGLR